ncbi:MAG: hypothetical protein DME34_01005 [Verrucomicrobia bacterium]|nr:MAG: hypothetical protein DME34_01005 [Verrucomicrobiota bacterium]
MNADEPSSSHVPRSALIAMLVIVVTMALVALYAGVQRLRRDRIEQVIVTPAASVTPSPAGP